MKKHFDYSEKYYNNFIKPLIYEGLTSSDITLKLGWKAAKCILSSIKLFASEDDKAKYEENVNLKHKECYKNKINQRTENVKNRYFEVIRPLIWTGATTTEIAKKCRVTSTRIYVDIKKFGSTEDKTKNQENNKIDRINRPTSDKKKAANPENERRKEKSKERYFAVIQPLIWNGCTTTEISKYLNLSDRARISLSAKNFGTQEDQQKLLQNGIDKRKQTIEKLMANKTSKPEKMLFDILKDVYPSAEHRFKVKNNHWFYELDVAVPDKKLNFEFDGEFWHKNCKSRDEQRDLFLTKSGWKVIRFSYSYVPSYEELSQAVKDQVAFL